jgi:hypothetical protein
LGYYYFQIAKLYKNIDEKKYIKYLKLSNKNQYEASTYFLYTYYQEKDLEIAFGYLEKFKYYRSNEEREEYLNFIEKKLSKDEFKKEKINFLKRFIYIFDPSFEVTKLLYKNGDFENSMIYLKHSINSMNKIIENELIEKFIHKKLKLLDVDSDNYKILIGLENYRIEFLKYFFLGE